MATHTHPPVTPSRSQDGFRPAPASPLRSGSVERNTRPNLPARRTAYQEVAREASQKLSQIEKSNAAQTQTARIPKVIHHLDTNTTIRVSRASNKLSEFLHHLANEPSIGLFHVSEHITRSVPKNIEMKKQLKESNRAAEELSYGLDSTLITVKDFGDINTFTSIKSLLLQSMATVNNIIKRVPYKPPIQPKIVETPAPVDQFTISPILEPTDSQPHQIEPTDGAIIDFQSPESPALIDFQATEITAKPKKDKKGKDSKRSQDFTMKKFDT